MAKPTRVLPPAEERRHFPRYYVPRGWLPDLVAHLGEAGAGRWQAHVLDLSKGGISLLSDRPLTLGGAGVLGLVHFPRGFACERAGRVVFAGEVNGAFLLGVAFAHQLTDAEMARLL